MKYQLIAATLFALASTTTFANPPDQLPPGANPPGQGHGCLNNPGIGGCGPKPAPAPAPAPTPAPSPSPAPTPALIPVSVTTQTSSTSGSTSTSDADAIAQATAAPTATANTSGVLQQSGTVTTNGGKATTASGDIDLHTGPATATSTGKVTGQNTGTFKNDGQQHTKVGVETNLGPVSSSSQGGKSDVKVDAKGGTSSATTGAMTQGATGSGNKTEITTEYKAAEIPVATAAAQLLPPVVCASSSSGVGVQTQVFGFNFGRSDSRDKCWASKEATECVNIAIATTQAFGMRRMMATVAVGCTVKSPTFVEFAKDMGQNPVEFAKEILASYEKVETTPEAIRQAATDRAALGAAQKQVRDLTVNNEMTGMFLEEAQTRVKNAEAALAAERRAAEEAAAAQRAKEAKRKAWLAAHPVKKLDCDKQKAMCEAQKK